MDIKKNGESKQHIEGLYYTVEITESDMKALIIIKKYFLASEDIPLRCLAYDVLDRVTQNRDLDLDRVTSFGKIRQLLTETVVL